MPRKQSSMTTYKVICISLYRDDLKTLDEMVEQLKRKGVTRANRSALIRYALSHVDLNAAAATFRAAR